MSTINIQDFNFIKHNLDKAIKRNKAWIIEGNARYDLKDILLEFEQIEDYKTILNHIKMLVKLEDWEKLKKYLQD